MRRKSIVGLYSPPAKPTWVFGPHGEKWTVTATDHGNVTLTAEDGTVAATAITDQDRSHDRVPDAPRMRMTIAAKTTLTASWQRLRFRKTGRFDVDTFPGGRYDTATDRLVAGADLAEAQYLFEFHWTVEDLTSAFTRVQLRFHIPRPASAGGPIYFPFPDATVPGVDLCVAALTMPARAIQPMRLYFETNIRAYGVHVEARCLSITGALVPVSLGKDTAIALYPT